jgi:hypothetical protein
MVDEILSPLVRESQAIFFNRHRNEYSDAVAMEIKRCLSDLKENKWIFRCGETACPAIRKPVVRKMETDLNAAAPPFRQMETTIPEQGTAEKYYSLNAGSMPYTSLIER